MIVDFGGKFLTSCDFPIVPEAQQTEIFGRGENMR
jgi:hypothetical protein